MTGKSWGVGSIGVSTYGPDDNWNGAGPPAGTPPADQGQGQAPPPPPPPSQPPGPSGCVGPGGSASPNNGTSCCPGLSSDPQWTGDGGGGDNILCNCPPVPCVPAGQTVPGPSVSGCPAPSCCPPSTNQGGTCKLPAGVIVGTYKTQYMASGSTNGGANFAAQLHCNSNNGCNGGGWTSAGRQGSCNDSRDWGHHHSSAHLWCAPPNPKGFCPTNIGTVVSGAWYGAGGGAVGGACGGGGTCDLRLQCTYSTVTNPFDPLTVAAFTGIGASDLTSPNGIQKMYCDTLPYASIGSGSPCAGFYSGTTKDYDFQQAMRINEEHSDGSWATDSTLFSLIANIAQGTSGVASPLGKQTAQSMILNYCVVQNQNGWPGIQQIRTQVNQWVLQENGNIGDDCQLLAADIVATFCSINSGSPYCDCFNATDFGANIFTACQGKTITPCTDINQMADSFSKAPPWFAPQIATLKSYITPKCAVRACVSVTTDPSQPYLAPDVFTNMVCESNIQLCLASNTVKGGMHAGSSIDQSCQLSMGITATVPNAPGGSTGCPAPGTAPPVTPTGLSGNLQVVAQSNAPGPVGSGPTTFGVVASPSGSTTQVQTTGAPGGGLVQTVTSSSPNVSLQSSGGPVTQTLVPSPSPGPSPVQSNVAPITNTQNYALLAGGGFLSLSFSFVAFIICCIILAMIFGRKKAASAAPRRLVVPISAYGL